MSHRFKQEGVWCADPSGVIHLTSQDIAFIEHEREHTAKRRARICAHKDSDRAHLMLIAFCADSFNPPHAHERPEAMLVMKGSLTVSFPATGEFSRRLLILHAGDFLRIPPGVVHQPLPITDCVILEIAEK
jgi:cupin fold WbuC family metalloprotein